MFKPFLVLSYLTKQNFYSILTISFFCFSLFFLIDLIELLRRSSSKEIPFDVILKIAFLHLPSLFPIIFPTIFLLSSMHTFMKLNKNNELSVMRSSGISIWFFMLPAILNCVIISIFYILVFNPIFSQMIVKFKSYEGTYFRGNAGLHTISPTGLWLREINNNGMYVINASHYSPLDNKLQNVIIFEFNKEEIFQRRIDVTKVEMTENKWKLYDTSVAKINKPPVFFEQMEMSLDLSIKKIEQNFRSTDTINFWKLPEYIENLKNSGFNAKKHMIYYHYLFSFPLILLTMVMLGCSLSIRKSRTKKQFLNVLIGLLTGVIFHFLLDVFRTMGISGNLNIFFSVWSLPFISIFILLGILIHLEDG